MKTRILLLLGAALALLTVTAAARAAADARIPDTAAWQALPPPDDGSVNALAASPNFPADQTLLAGTDSGVYLSSDGGGSWGTLSIAITPKRLILSPDYPTDPTIFAVTDATRESYDVLYRSVDGGVNWLPYPHIARAWETPRTPLPAGYAQDIRYAGAFAMRTGTGPSGPNVYSYSSARQWVSVPADASSATLTFWRYPTLGDLQAAGQDAVETAELLAAGPEVDDFQYLLAVFADGSYDMLRTWRDNSQTWTQSEVDLSAYAGRSFWLHFGTFNNGVGGRSGMVIDEVALRICRQAKVAAQRAFLPLLQRNHAAPTDRHASPAATDGLHRAASQQPR